MRTSILDEFTRRQMATMFPCPGKYQCTRIKRPETFSLLGPTLIQRKRTKCSLLPTIQSMLSCTLELGSMPTMATTPTLGSMYCWNIQILCNLITIRDSLQANFISVANCSFTSQRFADINICFFTRTVINIQL